MRLSHLFRMGILLAGAMAGVAWAQEEPCAQALSAAPTENKIARAVQIACQEHRLWREPFINQYGRLVKVGPMEAERDALADGSFAWRRVLFYWQNSVGVADLFRGKTLPFYDDAPLNEALTRVQILDTPWSAVFISYLMRQAGYTEEAFHFSDGHIRYIKPAYAAASNPTYAFKLHQPLQTPLAAGDLLCYARETPRVFGVRGFNYWLAQHHADQQSLKMHCDMVVNIQGNRAFTIGGNVVQSVTMRELKLTARGTLALQYIPPEPNEWWLREELLSESGVDDASSCRVNTRLYCDMNRQDWVALLRPRY